MRVFLEPNESLLFRTGRPFDAGETDYAETLFPPTPETLQGVMRALLATQWDTTKTLPEVFRPGSELVKLVGDRNGYGRFRITNISLGHRKYDDKEDDIELIYPVPSHLLKDEQDFLRLKPAEMTGTNSNMPPGMLYLKPERKTQGKLTPVEGWLTEANLRITLNAKEDLANLKVVKKGEIFKYESRVGIGMENATKVTREGMFYSVQMIRMQPGYGFVVDVRLTDETHPDTFIPDQKTQETLNLHKQGWATIGGEQRAASFRVIGTSTPLLQNTKHEGNGTVLYLATPASFKNGWRPEQWQTPLLAPIAAAIPRYQPIGGWKLRPEDSGGSNKCMRRCVPAGSVYFFDRFVTAPSALTDYDMEIGYGITATGEW
jgi:CRISPR-associated protein Cmr3